MTYSPFDSIPPELLSQILTLTWLSYADDDSTGRFRFPSISIQVNHYFNSVTFSTPILWSCLQVMRVDDLSHIQDRIEQKSGALPLDLYSIFPDMTSRELEEMIKGTILHSPSRFRTITLWYRNSTTEYNYSEAYWTHLRPLSTLPTLNPTRFTIRGDNRTIGPLAFLPSFGSALRSLNISYCYLTLSKVFLPDTLEVLSIQESGPSEWITPPIILRCFESSIRQSLRSLSLEGLNIQEAEGMPTESSVLGRLEELGLKNLRFTEVASLLSILITPNIRHLSLEHTYDTGTPETFQAFWDMFWGAPPWFPLLSKLTIQAFEADSHRLISLFGNVAGSVECLEIREDGKDDNSVNALLDPSSAPFCSRLRHITARGLSLPDLAELVQDRCRSLDTLQVAFGIASACSRGAHGALTRGQLAGYFYRLRSAVPELKIMRDRNDPRIDEPITLAFEELERQRVGD